MKFAVLACASLLLACSESADISDGNTNPDGGGPADGGVRTDAGMPPDAGDVEDGGPLTDDVGDAGGPVDGGAQPDGESPADGGVDAGGGLDAGEVDAGEADGGGTDAGGLQGRYLLAFDACDTSLNCKVMANRSVYIATSDDGAAWSPVPNYTAVQGTVPGVVRRNDTIYVFSPNPARLIRYNVSSLAQQATATFTLKSKTGSTETWADPSLHVDPSTGRLVMFFTYATGYSGDPANCTTCPIKSATEVDGSDGTEFVTDDGDRAAVALTGGNITDPDIFADPSGYVLYIAKSLNKVLAYGSPTLRGSYAPLSGLSGGILTTVGSIPAGYHDAAGGRYWTYITVMGPGITGVIKRAVHADFSKQLVDADFTTVVSGATYPGLGSKYMVGSPAFAENK